MNDPKLLLNAFEVALNTLVALGCEGLGDTGDKVIGMLRAAISKIKKETGNRKSRGGRRGAIRIVTEKTVNGSGFRGRNILHVEALPIKVLPFKYLSGDHEMVWFDGVQKALVCNKGSDLIEGFFFTEEDFQERLSYVKKAGENLAKVNENLREEKERWKGNETFEI